MATISQLFYLVKQEIRSASRSRYIILSFVFLPLFMWVLQGGVQVLINGAIADSATGGGETLFITSEDTTLATLSSEFNLTIDYNGNKAGDKLSAGTEINLTNYLINLLSQRSKDNNSAIYNVNIISNESYSEVEKKSQNGNIKFWLHIPADFSTNYNSTAGQTTAKLKYLTTGLLGPTVFQARLQSVFNEPPFTIVNLEKVSSVVPEKIKIGGEETEGFDFGVGFAGFLAIIIAVMAPAPFVATSFAGEREKKTMEALLALPISRRSILLGKLSAGMVLVGVFTVMNIVGMALFNVMVGTIPANGNEDVDRFSLVIDLDLITIISISVAMMLSAFIAIGIGIGIASLTKDVRTSESSYQILMMLPTMIVGISGMFIGVPESFETGGNFNPALFLYIIPWTHALAIFHKISSPTLYNLQSLTGFGLIGDLIFHLGSLFVMIAIIITIAAKIFEREGIVN